MSLGLVARVLGMRRRMRAREQASRQAIQQYQSEQLRVLRAHAYARSPFYRSRHRGLENAPLEELPVLTKRELMQRFDEIVTDPRVRLADVEAHLASLTGGEIFLGRYRAVRTAGTTGQPAILVSDPREWATIIASYERCQRWAGVEASPLRRTRLAVVSTRVPWHQSAQVGLSIESPMVPVRRFDAKEPLADIVRGLNEWQPENLIAYASMARVLAHEQRAGRLRIAPRAIMCASEVLTSEARQVVREAWSHEPYEVYAATETATIASDCAMHRRHVYEDLVIPEIVDEHGRPTRAGSFGAKVLVTVLFSRTLPLIRYELTDSVEVLDERCACGLPFRLIGRIQGRTEEILQLPSAAGDGRIMVHPNTFHDLLEPLAVQAWQVVQEPDRLRILLVDAGGWRGDAELRRSLEDELRRQGVRPPEVVIERIPELPRTSAGKAPHLVVAAVTKRD